MGPSSWIVWMPLAPVPMTAIRLFLRFTPHCGHTAVWKTSPLNEDRPLIGGVYRLAAKPMVLYESDNLVALALKEGDAINLAGSHVVIFLRTETPDGAIWIATPIERPSSKQTPAL